MNDEHDEHELSPEEDARVRALLADAGSSTEEQVPADVAARLDATLADLVAEREQEGSAATVVPLRRRWTRDLTAAAAAVIVLGVGGVAVGNLGSSSSDDAASSKAGGGVAADSGGDEAQHEQAPSVAPTDT